MWVISPNEQMGRRYEELVSPLEALILTLVRQNRNLHTQRDLLLPKLVSGEIDVSEAEEILEEAVA